MVEAQVGRPLRGAWSVVHRCHLGIPTVIESHPLLEDGKPFPTLYWLTCPILVKRASALESKGTMALLTSRLQEEPRLQGALAAAIERLKRARDAHEVVEVSGGPPGGGPDRVKCLHAHVAHELADPPNPIGAWTLAATGWPDCRLPCFSVQPDKETDR
ncbi:MAG: DUF501 domain-containing protein [Actinobacteria bacterium]|nr:DUF501 domain-containing protein [Actinomycetota bacterium]